jgi:hypothetical protein
MESTGAERTQRTGTEQSTTSVPAQRSHSRPGLLVAWALPVPRAAPASRWTAARRTIDWGPWPSGMRPYRGACLGSIHPGPPDRSPGEGPALRAPLCSAEKIWNRSWTPNGWPEASAGTCHLRSSSRATASESRQPSESARTARWPRSAWSTPWPTGLTMGSGVAGPSGSVGGSCGLAGRRGWHCPRTEPPSPTGTPEGERVATGVGGQRQRGA